MLKIEQKKIVLQMQKNIKGIRIGKKIAKQFICMLTEKIGLKNVLNILVNPM